jgi:hypothetical protein
MLFRGGAVVQKVGEMGFTRVAQSDRSGSRPLKQFPLKAYISRYYSEYSAINMIEHTYR